MFGEQTGSVIDIFMLEDSPRDAALLSRILQRDGLAFRLSRVDRERDYRARLQRRPLPDIILADYLLPEFDGLKALTIACDLAPSVPFIFVSAAIGEDRAMEALRQGATDYITKDRPARLPAAIKRAIYQHDQEEARRRAERRYRLATSATRDVIWELDVATRRFYFNEALRTEWGHDVEEPLDHAWWLEHVHPDDRQNVLARIGAWLDSGEERCAFEYRFAHANGTYGQVLDRTIVVRDESGEPVQLVGAMQDLSARKEIEEALAEAQQMAKIGHWSCNLAIDRLRWSEETYRILGVPRGTEPTNRAFLRSVHPDDQHLVRRLFQETCSEPRDIRFRVVRPDDSIRIVHSHVRCIFDRGRPSRIVGTLQDVTEIVNAQETIQTLRREADVILEHTGDGIIALDERGRPTRVNPAAAWMLAWEVEDLMQVEHLHAILCHPPGEDRLSGGEECPLASCLANGKPSAGEATFWRRDGVPLFVHYTCTPLDGGLVLAFQDLTERIRLERQIRQAERVSGLGRAAATITHEFRNVLMGMIPFAEIIRRRASDEVISNAVAKLLSGIQRGKQITSQILQFAGQQDASPAILDVAEWFRKHHADLCAVAKDRTAVQLRIDDAPLDIRCDPAQLQQVIANLVINAADAMHGRGVVDVVVRRNNGEAVVEVVDHGEGIPPEVLPDIFEPLFTTKRHGTGLGLAVAQQLVFRNGGTIDVESRVGEGTKFILRFPLAGK